MCTEQRRGGSKIGDGFYGQQGRMNFGDLLLNDYHPHFVCRETEAQIVSSTGESEK